MDVIKKLDFGLTCSGPLFFLERFQRILGLYDDRQNQVVAFVIE